MKKLLVILGASLMALTVVSADLLAADGHGLNPYRTPEFIRNPAQMANNTDLLSASVYNPAGLTKFEDGVFVGLGNIVILKSNELKTSTAKYEQDTPSYLVPTMAVAYKTGKSAVFLNYEVFDGGGTAVYDKYPNTLGNVKAEGSSSWTQFKLGGSYDLIEMVSLTGGVRYMMTTQTAKATQLATGPNLGLGNVPAGYVLKNDETTADGQAGFFGINITPVKEATINVTYFTKGFVQGETKHKADTTAYIPAGFGGKAAFTEYYEDVVPSYLTFGVSYLVMPELKVSAGMNYVFTKEEKYGDAANETKIFTKQKNAMELALGADYKVMDMVTASAGFAYKAAGGTKETYDAEATNPDLDLYVIGLGAKVTPMPGLNVNVGVMKAFFQEGNSVTATTKYNRDAWLMSLGVDYKI